MPDGDRKLSVDASGHLRVEDRLHDAGSSPYPDDPMARALGPAAIDTILCFPLESLMKKLMLFLVAAIALPGCVKMVSVNRAMFAPARADDCELELVQADMMELSPMGTTWDYLGTVSIGANHHLDPMSEEARAVIRPKACELGGTAVALMQGSNSASTMGGGGAVTYAVLRPKQAPAAPTKF